MVWPTIDQRKNLKIFGVEAGADRLGLYGPNKGDTGSQLGTERAQSQGRNSNQEDDSFSRDQTSKTPMKGSFGKGGA